MDINTDALEGMTSAQAEAAIKAQLAGETNPEPVEPIEEVAPQQEVKTEEVVIPKDKFVQKEKILKSQIHSWKQKAEKAEADKADLLRKIESWEVENNLDAQAELIERLVEARLARANMASSEENDKIAFIKNHPAEAELLTQIEEVMKENPTLSIEQARILFLAENMPERVYDPTEDNRQKLSRQSTSGMSVSSEEKTMDNMSSDELMKMWKSLHQSGKLSNNF